MQDKRGPDGIEGNGIYLKNLCSYFEKINQEYLILYNSIDRFSNLMKSNNLNFLILDFPRYSLFNFFKIIKLYKIKKRLLDIIKKEEITHICLQNPNLQIFLSDKLTIPVICYQHSAFDPEVKKKSKNFNQFLHNFYMKNINKCNKVDKVLCVSDASYQTARHLFKIPKKKLLINHYGIPENIFSEYKKRDVSEQNKNSEFVILSVGSVYYPKGVEDFCEVAKIVKNKYNNKNIKFIFIGGYRSYSYFKYILNKYDKFVSFTGVQKDISSYYSISDIFLFLSHRESAGLVLMEAMSFKLKIIASNIFGINEVIENNKSGILIDYNDHNKISEKIMEIYNNKPLDNINENAYKRYLSNYTIKKSAQNFINIVKNL